MNSARWHLLEAIFHTASGLRPEDRAAYLDEHCSADQDLRHDVESLLAANSGAEGFLNTPAFCLDSRPGADSGSDEEASTDRELLPERLRQALGDSYQLLREVGRGGMGTVFLARDLKHRRSVALKVLRRDLAATLGVERFRREVALAARLQHPHICSVFDSGETAAGDLWFTMPFVEGESLRDRLRREGRLVLEDALRIVNEAGRALAYAHEHAVIHRDVKPENILLTLQGDVLVADFGVARALGTVDAEQPPPLTESGLALGTPAYMSPEQARGDCEVDARSDVYSLATVIYELLTGELPYPGATIGAVVTARYTSPVPSARTVRPEVSAIVNAAIQRGLAVDRAARWPSMFEFLDALSVTQPRAIDNRPKSRVGKRVAIVAIALVLALTGLALAHRRSTRALAASNPASIAVAPFRTSGASPTLGYLRDGMTDLLAAALERAGGRAVDPRSVLDAWRDAGGGDLPPGRAADLAARLGAGRVLQGEVVGTPDRLVLHAELFVAPGGGIARAERSVSGPADSLPALVDRLAAAFLSLEAGEAEAHVLSLTSTPLAGLRAYLAGKALVRAERFTDALAQFDTALQIDSGFALAGLGYVEAARLSANNELVERGARVAWRHRDQLPPLDRIYLDVLGVAYPAPPSRADQIAAAKRYTEAAPGSAQAWAWLGERLYSFGALTGTPRSLTRARAAINSAIALNPAFRGTSSDLPAIDAELGDTAALRAEAFQLALHDSGGDVAAERWFAATVLGDQETVRALRPRLTAMTLPGELSLVEHALDEGANLDDAERVAAAAWSRAPTQSDQRAAATMTRHLWLDRGRPTAWARQDESLVANEAWCDDCMRALDAVLWDGDSAVGALAARRLSSSLEPPLAASQAERRDQALRLLAASEYGLAHGDSFPARRARVLLSGRAVNNDTTGVTALCAHVALLLDAELTATDRLPEARALLVRLDSLLTGAPSEAHLFLDVANLAASRLWAAQGEPLRALAAVRRQSRGYLRPFHTTYLREEGRLAAITGDRQAAAHAYRLYLRLRADPEPVLQNEVEKVRVALAALERSAGGPLASRR